MAEPFKIKVDLGPFKDKKRRYQLGWSKIEKKLYFVDNETGLRSNEMPDGIGTTDVGDWLELWSQSNQCHYWFNHRTGKISDTEKCPLPTAATVSGAAGRMNGTVDLRRDGLQVSDNPYGHGLHRQHPDFDARATRKWRHWKNNSTEEIDDGLVTKERKEEKESSNAMAEETKENQRIANRDRVRACRARKNPIRKAVAKLRNTLGKRLLRQNEKRPYHCDVPVLTDKQWKQADQVQEQKKAKATEEMRKYRAQLSTEKKDEQRKRNTKRKAELRQLQKERETSLERIQRLEQQAYTTRKSMCKKIYGDKKYGNTFGDMAASDYYMTTFHNT